MKTIKILSTLTLLSLLWLGLEMYYSINGMHFFNIASIYVFCASCGALYWSILFRKTVKN